MSRRKTGLRPGQSSARPPKQRVVDRAAPWRETALLLACAEIAILVAFFDPAGLNVFDLPKAAISHALAWPLFGVLIVIGLMSGLRIPASPLFLAFYLVLAVDLLTTFTA